MHAFYTGCELTLWSLSPSPPSCGTSRAAGSVGLYVARALALCLHPRLSSSPSLPSPLSHLLQHARRAKDPAHAVFKHRSLALDDAPLNVVALPDLRALDSRDDGHAEREGGAAETDAAVVAQRLVGEPRLHGAEAHQGAARHGTQVVAVAHAPQRTVVPPQLGEVVQKSAHRNANGSPDARHCMYARILSSGEEGGGVRGRDHEEEVLAFRVSCAWSVSVFVVRVCFRRKMMHGHQLYRSPLHCGLFSGQCASNGFSMHSIYIC